MLNGSNVPSTLHLTEACFESHLTSSPSFSPTSCFPYLIISYVLSLLLPWKPLKSHITITSVTVLIWATTVSYVTDNSLLICSSSSRLISDPANSVYQPPQCQSLSCVRLFATPWTAACQASLSITNPWSYFLSFRQLFVMVRTVINATTSLSFGSVMSFINT